MSESPFPPFDNPALMTPTKARDIARGYKWLSDQLRETGGATAGVFELRQSEWWLRYALVLERTDYGGA